jgi:hypothetical protein
MKTYFVINLMLFIGIINMYILKAPTSDVYHPGDVYFVINLMLFIGIINIFCN